MCFFLLSISLHRLILEEMEKKNWKIFIDLSQHRDLNSRPEPY